MSVLLFIFFWASVNLVIYSFYRAFTGGNSSEDIVIEPFEQGYTVRVDDKYEDVECPQATSWSESWRGKYCIFDSYEKALERAEYRASEKGLKHIPARWTQPSRACRLKRSFREWLARDCS